MTTAKRVPPSQRSKYKTVAEVARLCGRGVKTVKRWIQDGLIDGPAHYEPLGEDGYTWLYSAEDVVRFVAFARTQKPGRKPTSPSN